MLQKTRGNCKIKAFTLLELLISMSILIVLLLIITPSIKDFVQKNIAEAKVYQIVAALQFARSEAINRGQKVTFCKSSDGASCSGNWISGQIVLDADSKVIRVLDKIPDGDNLIWKSSLSEDKNDFVRFLPTGETDGQQGSFFYCSHGNPNNSFAIIIQNSGFFRVSSKTSEGKDVTC